MFVYMDILGYYEYRIAYTGHETFNFDTVLCFFARKQFLSSIVHVNDVLGQFQIGESSQHPNISILRQSWQFTFGLSSRKCLFRQEKVV